MANYEVDPALLTARIPAGTSLDLYQGKCFLSLVGFMFLETRVRGFRMPFHVNFEEVNLRFYVKRELPGEVRRGVCFVKELVPRYAIATIARVFYGEPYECWQMSHQRSHGQVSYSWNRTGLKNRIGVDVRANTGVPAAGSHGEFIIEHYWGYTARSEGRVDEYRVEHPKWELFSTANDAIHVDFGAVYGSEFAFLSEDRPYSVLLAQGSAIAVYQGSQITV
jgi:uncharacterized protein